MIPYLKRSKSFWVLLLGFALYCVWSVSVSITFSAAANVFGELSSLFWILSNTVTLASLALCRIGYRRVDSLIGTAIARMVIGCLAPMGIVMLLIGLGVDSVGLCLGGVAVASAANIFQVMLWAHGFRSAASDGERKFVAFAAVAVATFAYQGVAALDETSRLCLTAVFAIASTASYFVLRRFAPMAKAVRKREQRPEKSGLVFLAFVLVASIPMNYLTTVAGNAEGGVAYGGDAVFRIVPIVLTLFMGLEALAYRKRATLVPLFVVVFFTGAMLVLLLSDESSGVLFGVSSYVGFYLLLPMMYYEMAVRSSGVESPVKAFSSGLLANSIGVLLGTLLAAAGELFDSSTPALVAMLVTYGTIILAAVFLPNSAYRLFTARIPSEVERMGNPYSEAVDEGCKEVASLYRLTDREEDIAGFLVRGRSLATIGKILGLSTNTVKTHVSHIYQKCGTHNREEFIILFESFLSE